MSSNYIFVNQKILDAVKYKKRIPVSQWSEENRVLITKSAAIAGKWKNSNAPYLTKIMDMFNDHNILDIGIFASSQTGKTEAMFNMMFYSMDRDPAPMMYMIANDSLADFTASERILPGIKSCRETKRLVDEVVTNEKMRQKTKLIRFTGGYIKIVGSNSEANRKSAPIKYLFLDETAEFQKGAEEETVERTKTYEKFGAKRVRVSTYKTPNDPIVTFYKTADCAMHYYVPCPKCGKKQELKFPQVSYLSKDEVRHQLSEKSEQEIEDVYINIASKSAVYTCAQCNHKLTDTERFKAVQKGDWEVVRGDISGAKSVAFKINAMYSQFTSLEEITKNWLKAEGIEELEEKFYQGWLAEIYEKDEKATKADELLTLIKTDLDQGEVIENTLFLTMSVDVQLDHFWFEIEGWLQGAVSYSIRSGRVENFWELEDIFRAQYYTKISTPYKIKAVAIDSGYRTDEVYEFCGINSDIVIPIKGVEKLDSQWRVRPVQKDVHGKNIASGLKLYTINTEYFKDMLNTKISTSILYKAEGDDKNVRFFLHNESTLDYAKQMTSEYKKREVDKKGKEKYTWQKRRRRADNHLWDCAVYNQFLAEMLGVRYLKATVKKRPTKRPATASHKPKNHLEEY